MLKKYFCLILALILAGVTGLAQDIPARPVPPRLVNDFANILSDNQIATLESKLEAFSDTTSTQICVVTITSLDGTDSNDYAQQLGEKWGVGHKENNGAVILVLPKIGNENGDVAIQVGYGLEPYVTDKVIYDILTKQMVPAFRQEDYYTGINEACDTIIELTLGHFAKDDDEWDSEATGGLIIFILIIALIVYLAIIAKGKGGGSGRKHFGGYSSFGGSKSHSFSGFGGGHFGGGGASAKW